MLYIYILRETNNHLHEWFSIVFTQKNRNFFFLSWLKFKVHSRGTRFSLEVHVPNRQLRFSILIQETVLLLLLLHLFVEREKMNKSKTVKVDLLWRQRESFMPLHFSGSPFKIPPKKNIKEEKKISSQQLCCTCLIIIFSPPLFFFKKKKNFYLPPPSSGTWRTVSSPSTEKKKFEETESKIENNLQCSSK